MHTDEFQWTTAWLVFTTYFVVDILYARYITEVAKKRAFRAAVISCFLYSLLAYGVISYSRNTLYLVPLVCGAFLGTYVTVRFQR
jgi:tryptophan-rich sensory protein